LKDSPGRADHPPVRRPVPLVILGIALAAVCCSPAIAAVPDRVAQDDGTILCRWHDRDRALAQMRAAGFTHVRITLTHAPGPDGVGLATCGEPGTLDDYDRAVAAVRAAGLVPQLTLAWSHMTDANAIAPWLEQMVAHFTPEVQRFSVLNEPDLTIPASDLCDPETVAGLVTSGALHQTTDSWWSKRYLRHRVRVRRHGRTVQVWRQLYGWRVGTWGRPPYAPVRVRLYRWVAHTREVVADDSADSSQQPLITVKQGCLEIQRARIYRRIYQAAAPAIRAAAPGAELLAGETSPVAGVDLFIQTALPLDADGWAHHCYQWDLTPAQSAGGFGIGDTARVQALVGMPLFLTECGYPNADSAWDQTRWNGLFTHDNLPDAYVQMWQFARDQGVREMSQFQWCSNNTDKWDTSLMVGPGCDPGAEYRALAALINSWG
jgi:hypothetical protein